MDFDFKASGRLCVRRLSEGYVSIGVLRFPAGFRPEVGTGYPLVTRQGGIEALPIALAALDSIQLSGGISEWAARSDWREAQDCIMARFIDAAPVGWTTLAVSRSNPFPEVFSEEDFAATSHQWLDIKDGQAERIASPVHASRLVGNALTSIVRDLPVWPDRSGSQFWTLPVLTLEARHAFDLNAQLRELEDAGKITPEVSRSFNRLPLMAKVMPMPLSADEDFGAFLALARSYGFNHARDGLRTASESRRIEEFSSAAVKVLAEADRHGQTANEFLSTRPEKHAQLRLLASRSAYEDAPVFFVGRAWQDQDLHWAANDKGDLIVASLCSEEGVWEPLQGADFEALQAEVHSLVKGGETGSEGDLLASNVDALRVLPNWALREMATRDAARQHEMQSPESVPSV